MSTTTLAEVADNLRNAVNEATRTIDALMLHNRRLRDEVAALHRELDGYRERRNDDESHMRGDLSRPDRFEME